MKIYLSHYENVYSLELSKAIQLCTQIVESKNNCVYDLSNYGKLLKSKSSKQQGYLKNRNKYFEVHHCLDWGLTEWKELLVELSNISIGGK